MKNKQQTVSNPPATVWRSALALLILILVAIPSFVSVFPSRVVSADAPDSQFSAERAMAHLPVLAAKPHPQGSPAQAVVRDYLVDQLTGMNLEVELQQINALENVVARLRGTDPSGAIVILAHYDTTRSSNGAGDNGSAVGALVEIMRALSAGPLPRNDIIALFDDGEELPGAFSGTYAFVGNHPWMSDVRVAISIDTAVAGSISVNEAGPNNGWLVDVLAKAYNGGAWTSFSGGGQYNSTPFREAGYPVLALEDNYPFRQKHTTEDLPGIIRPASVQQMGEQTLAIARELGERDLTDPWGEQETFFPVPLLGLAHYPETWSLPLSITAGVLLLTAIGLALWRKIISWRGFFISLGMILVAVIVAVFCVTILMPKLPVIFHWNTSAWPDWPEVIPPNGWVPVIAFDLFTLALSVLGYILTRRWCGRADVSLAGIFLFLIPAVLLSIALPRVAYPFIWTVLVGASSWILAAVIGRKHLSWSLDLASLLPAIPLFFMLLVFVPGVVMADGMKSLNILVGIEALILGASLPAVDGLLIHRKVAAS